MDASVAQGIIGNVPRDYSVVTTQQNGCVVSTWSSLPCLTCDRGITEQVGFTSRHTI